MEKLITIALLGQPNSGKSTIFNTLTRMRQHVGNWPGKTVEKKEGFFVRNGVRYRVTDLPGSYCLSANSDEEIVTRNYIAQNDLDLVCVLADASQLERSMYMLADFAGIRTPAVLLLTMMDVAQAQGKCIDTDVLSDRLGIPVLGLNASDEKAYDGLKELLERAAAEGKTLAASKLWTAMEEGEKGEEFEACLRLAERITTERLPACWLAGKMLEEDASVLRRLKEAGAEAVRPDGRGALYVSGIRFDWIGELLDGVVTQERNEDKILSRFDRIAIGPRSGPWLAFGMSVAALLGAMIVAAPLMGLGSAIPLLLNPLLDRTLGPAGVSAGTIHFVKATLVTALGWVVAMTGFVFAMSFVMGVLEEVGYMARVSYVFDRSMSRIGLQGKAIMPMFMGLGCTMGSASGARVIDSYGQKILTIAVAWAVPCGATFVVIPTLANAFFGGVGGVLVMLLIFAVMFLHIIVTAKIFGRRLNPAKQRTGIIMELPPYHRPRLGFIFRNSLMRMWDVFRRAFSVEIVVCVIFYLLSASPSGIEGSILYKAGIWIEPVSRFFGMGWQTFMSFAAATVSKEAVLGVLSAIFANSGSVIDTTMGLTGASDSVAQIAASMIPRAEALAFIVAVTFNIPCLQAVVSTYHETHSAKWTAKIGTYYVASALLLSCLTYHIAGLFM
ncbi:ferrous iron transport protein B [Lachnoclostridium sp. Marseille-P6806]|uniref:ferrous iron transport protein B n=1 Tax=Lachnoclostridium sp. Marseille-P6806 TaxID=2364793 RepID=UPI00102F345D|nr:ferrous iron transport protein B [Lachnoclostridium sp. Marseille-P6806]